MQSSPWVPRHCRGDDRPRGRRLQGRARRRRTGQVSPAHPCWDQASHGKLQWYARGMETAGHQLCRWLDGEHLRMRGMALRLQPSQDAANGVRPDGPLPGRILGDPAGWHRVVGRVDARRLRRWPRAGADGRTDRGRARRPRSVMAALAEFRSHWDSERSAPAAGTSGPVNRFVKVALVSPLRVTDGSVLVRA